MPIVPLSGNCPYGWNSLHFDQFITAKQQVLVVGVPVFQHWNAKAVTLGTFESPGSSDGPNGHS
jgi:hypothetical protein